MADTSRALVTIEKLLQKIGKLVIENDALREMIAKKQNEEKKEADE